MHRDILTHLIILQIRRSCPFASFLSSVLGLFYAFTMKLVVSGCQGRLQQLQSQLRQVSSQPFEAQLAEEKNCHRFLLGRQVLHGCKSLSWSGFEWLWYRQMTGYQKSNIHGFYGENQLQRDYSDSIACFCMFLLVRHISRFSSEVLWTQ